jgi:hypothetical protein
VWSCNGKDPLQLWKSNLHKGKPEMWLFKQHQCTTLYEDDSLSQSCKSKQQALQLVLYQPPSFTCKISTKREIKNIKWINFWVFQLPFFLGGGKKLKPPVFNVQFQYLAKSIEGYIFNKLSYLAYSQIWLNLLMDDYHFGYIAKFSKKNNDSQSSAWEPLVGPMVACWKLKPIDFFGGCASSIFKLLMHPGRFYAWRTKGINNNRQQSWRGIPNKQTNKKNIFQKWWNFHAL